MRKARKQARFSASQQAIWFSLLSDLLSVGFSLIHAIEFLQTALPKTAVISHKIDDQLKDGQSLATAIHPFISADLYCQLELAEKHGQIELTLREIGQFLTARINQRRKLLALLQYPILLLMMLLVMLVALQVFVFPEIKSWQEASGGVHNQWLHWCFVGLGGLVLSICVSLLGWLLRFKGSPVVKRVNMLCSLPIFGKACRLYYSYYVINNLAVMLRHGMSLSEVGRVASNFEPKSLMHQIGQDILQIGTNGTNLTVGMKRYAFAPDELKLFLQKGEPIEKLGGDLTAFANIQFHRLLESIENLMNFVQPLIFAVIAIVIVAMYLSILLPIYQSLQGVY